MHRMLVALVVCALMTPAAGLAQARVGIREFADSQIGGLADWRPIVRSVRLPACAKATAGLAKARLCHASDGGQAELVKVRLKPDTTYYTEVETALAPALPQQPAKKRSWPGRHPVLFGALVGAGAGLAIEAAVIPGASGGEPHSAYIPMFVCTGAGIGSLVGLIISAGR